MPDDFFGDLVNIAGGFVRAKIDIGKAVVTALPTTAIDIRGDEDRILSIVTGIFTGPNDKLRCRLVNEVLRRSPGLINLGTFLGAGRSLCGIISKKFKARLADQLLKDIINCSLELVESIVDLVTPDMLLKILKKIISAILEAFISIVGNL